MYLSTSDGVNGVDIDDKSQIQQGNTPPVISHSSQPSSPSCSTLLVIDDNSNSNDSCVNTSNIPSNLISSNAQTESSPSLPIVDASTDTPEQQRRRNSSIAKLLGGQPLDNQQYEEINQQILDDQSAQNVPGNSDGDIPRSRSSITRTLLMNAEQNKNIPTSSTKARPTSPGFSTDFEYLIRRELDIEHAPSTLRRDSSTPSVFQNLNSLRNSPSSNPPSPSRTKLKRKRPQPKQTVPLRTTNPSPNVAPFSIRDPFELDSSAPSSVPPINSSPLHRSHHHRQNDLFHFDIAHHHQNHPSPLLPPPHPHPQLSTNHSTSFAYPKLSLPLYAQYKSQHDRSSTASSCSSSSCTCCRYPRTPELTLPTPVSAISIHPPSPSIISPHNIGASSRKTKAIHNRPDLYEPAMHRSFSTTSSQSNTSTSSSPSVSSGYSIPLKKRLLHAYINEQRPSSSL